MEYIEYSMYRNIVKHQNFCILYFKIVIITSLLVMIHFSICLFTKKTRNFFLIDDGNINPSIHL